YNYYHMDGQFAVIEDYLETRPEMKDRLLALVKADRIQIGPWYILQDEYLTSGEANIRNMLYGIRLCRKFGGDPVMTGYFPDAFGNISQAPQIIAGFGIDNAVFGRGMNDIGSDNQLVKQNGITGSELIWQAPDGTEVLGVMFANWYHNAMELPTEKEALLKRIQHIKASTERFAATPELLGMNGCDHQPVQVDLTKAIKLANEIQDEVTLKQSNFKDYIEAVRPYRDKLKVCKGEIAGQLTTGKCLLINTASCRVDIKQTNQAAQNLLERLAEPVNAYSFLYGDKYDRDYYLYCWRKLMQNHPHDSICSCSHDDIYEEMRIRFKKSMQAAGALRKNAMEYLAKNTDTSAGEDRNILLYIGETVSGDVEAETFVDYPLDAGVESIVIMDEAGNEVPAVITPMGRTFTYTLPDDKFRQPDFVNRFAVRFRLPTDGKVGTRMLRVIPGKAEHKTSVTWNGTTLENSLTALKFAKDGSFFVTDKRNGVTFGPCNLFEDTKDGGNTYNYEPVEGDVPVTTEGVTAAFSVSETPYSITVTIKHAGHFAGVATSVTLYDNSAYADIRTEIKNEAENHRVRALFKNDVKTDVVYAAGQFDIVKRDIQPWANWTNPYNTQRSEQFVMLKDADNAGFITAHRGLNEYEILLDGKNTMALTLLRCVGEIGDWGDFPTPLAQCKGTYTLEYRVLPFGAAEEENAVAAAYGFASNAVTAISCDKHAGKIPADGMLFACKDPMIRIAACKCAEDDDDLILRVYNIDEKERPVDLTFGSLITGVSASEADERMGEALPLRDGTLSTRIPAKKIKTYRLHKN
ncbi:MAG: glycosyl hydrolase-related protein, partial [Clostridia bacterium]|nr:glycosyl hydrolase-related protein [Clostridia bacterium]